MISYIVSASYFFFHPSLLYWDTMEARWLCSQFLLHTQCNIWFMLKVFYYINIFINVLFVMEYLTKIEHNSGKPTFLRWIVLFHVRFPWCHHQKAVSDEHIGNRGSCNISLNWFCWYFYYVVTYWLNIRFWQVAVIMIG